MSTIDLPTTTSSSHQRRVAGDLFRNIMSGVAAPVTVVTTLLDGRPHGTTVSAFSSLSMDPPLILASLDNGSDLLAAVKQTRRMGINVLQKDQYQLALNFAKKGETKFTDIEWSNHHASPRLLDVKAFMCCEVVDIVPGGDHCILLGAVEAGEVLPGGPLTYFERSFGTHHATAI